MAAPRKCKSGRMTPLPLLRPRFPCFPRLIRLNDFDVLHRVMALVGRDEVLRVGFGRAGDEGIVEVHAVGFVKLAEIGRRNIGDFRSHRKPFELTQKFQRALLLVRPHAVQHFRAADDRTGKRLLRKRQVFHDSDRGGSVAKMIDQDIAVKDRHSSIFAPAPSHAGLIFVARKVPVFPKPDGIVPAFCFDFLIGVPEDLLQKVFRNGHFFQKSFPIIEG